jgi:hypothetical protein
MKYHLKYKVYGVPVVLWMIIVLIAIILGSQTIELKDMTFYQLSSEPHRFSWIVNMAWISSGLLIAFITLLYYKRDEFSKSFAYTLSVFGLSMFLIGMYGNDVDLDSTVLGYQMTNYQLMYGVSIISILVAMWMHSFLSHERRLKLIHLSHALVLVICVMLYTVLPVWRIAIECLGWLIVFYWLLGYFGKVDAHDIRRF